MASSTSSLAAFGPLTNQVWQVCYTSLGWLQSIVTASGASRQPASLASNAALVLQSLLAGVEVLEAQSTLNAVLGDLPMIRAVAGLPITYSSSQSTNINGRIASLTDLIAFLRPITVPSATLSPDPVASLNLGQPSIVSPNLLGTYATWHSEPTPTGFLQSGLPTFASSYTTDWNAIVTGVANYYGVNPLAPLDAAIRAAQGSNLISTVLQNLFLPTTGSSSPLPTAQVWNATMTLPAALASANLLRPDVSLESSQSSMATRAFLLTMAEQLGSFILGAKGFASSASASGANAVLSQQGQGLMDIASQQLGSFESWRSITGSLPAPWGADALAAGTQVMLTSGSSGLTQAAILGTDIDLGPLGTAIPGWTGDLPITVGLSNYRGALARRLTTSLGALIYHQTYGSRIPPELGQILTTGAQSLITAYGKSALASDPRTQAVISASTAMLSGQPNAVLFSAQVQPVGPGLTPVQVNEVVAP
jgi:hypothetical protein